MKRFLFLFLNSLFIFLTAYSQQRTITGKVVSQADGSFLPGVSVVVKGLSKGTATDKEGSFKIAVSDEARVLVFSNVGYTTQEVPLTNSSTYDVKLAESSA